jgi:hypothetical protein
MITLQQARDKVNIHNQQMKWITESHNETARFNATTKKW